MRDKDGIELDALDLREWIEYGIAQGWVTEPTCYNHDQLPVTVEEAADMEEGGDPCINVMRLWDF